MKTAKKRSSQRRPYNKVYYIVTEGRVTEPSYFSLMASHIPDNAGIAVACKRARTSSIPSILDSAKQLALQDLRGNDEVWVALDQDSESHTSAQIAKLVQWGHAENCHVAMSAPRFEFWLLCHFEEAPTRADALSDTYVAGYLPGYDRKKSLDRHKGKITAESIRHAVRVAARFPCPEDGSAERGSDVWRLVQKILGASAR